MKWRDFSVIKQLLSVSDTLPRGVGEWVAQSPFSVVFERHGPPPPGVGVGFSWVLGLRALELRGNENCDIVFTLCGASCTIFGRRGR